MKISDFQDWVYYGSEERKFDKAEARIALSQPRVFPMGVLDDIFFAWCDIFNGENVKEARLKILRIEGFLRNWRSSFFRFDKGLRT